MTVNTHTKYIVYNHNGTGVRHHHFGPQNNIIDEADGTATTGNQHVAQGFPWQFYQGQNVPFAFMSVHGAADGNHLYTSPGNQSVPVGNTDIDVLVVYAPPGGIGGPDGGPGVWVDAFDVNLGDFSDALDFIQVLTPPTPPDTPDAPKTTYANVEGVVSTLTAENIRASLAVDGGVPFVEWKKIMPMETEVSAREVDLTQAESGEIWLAFYQTVAPNVSIPDLRGKLAETMGRWIDDDYCGTPYPHHIGPNGPVFQVSIPPEFTRSLTPAQLQQLATLSKEYASVATSAYAAMTKVTNLLGAIGNIFQGRLG
ncbi:MAG: hypothetical protein WA821_15690 [Anaerolineales bacterium]